MRRRTTSYDKSYVGSSGAGLKSDNLRKRVRDLIRTAARAENLSQQSAMRRSHGLVRDLLARRSPAAARRDAIMDVQSLARDIFAGRLTLAEARAQLRGES